MLLFYLILDLIPLHERGGARGASEPAGQLRTGPRAGADGVHISATATATHGQMQIHVCALRCGFVSCGFGVCYVLFCFFPRKDCFGLWATVLCLDFEL